MSRADDTNATRPSLLLRIRDPRDAESWALFAGLYSPLILRYVRKRGLQEADAADVAQDVLAQVARSIRGFEYSPERGRFRDWLGTVVRHRVHRFLKLASGHAQATGDNDLGDVEVESEWTEAFNAHVLRTALERVRPGFEEETWAAFRLAWLDQIAAPEAAAKLGVSVAKVYLSKSRVLQRLREEVSLLAEDWPLEPK